MSEMLQNNMGIFNMRLQSNIAVPIFAIHNCVDLRNLRTPPDTRGENVLHH